jgi:hypothetical protein
MSTPTKTRGLQWLFNTEMLAGAVLGWLITTSVPHLIETANHHGPGTVWYQNRDPEEEILPESEYKRYRYAEGGIMLGLGLVGWCIFASAFRDKTHQ